MPHTPASLPVFYLYGEPQRAVSEGFVHVEALDDRSRPSEWTISDHRHAHLSHLIMICTGGGMMRAEGETVHFDAPCLLAVPSGVVHGFRWHSESSGFVCTMADSHMDQILHRHADLRGVLASARAVVLDAPAAAEAEAAIRAMERELGWAGLGQRAAVEAALLALLVIAARHAQLAQASGARGREAALVARLRQRIEARFRLREQVGDHARALGVSRTALRLACARVAGQSPAAMLDARAMLEARRLLLYSDLPVSAIALAVGFEDAAYFSRFFARHAGQPPSGFRAGQPPGGYRTGLREDQSSSGQ